MKKIAVFTILLSAALAFSTDLSAQNSPSREVLFGSGTSVGFFLSPAAAFTQMDGAGVALFHLRGGVTLQDKFSIGAFYNVSVNDFRPESEFLPDIYMDYWSVGGAFEYTFSPSKLVHLSFPLYAGFGEVEMDREDGNAGLGESNFFLVEPSALLEVNLHKYVRLNAGAGYRIVGQMNYRNFDQSDLSGLTAYIGLKFDFSGF